MVQQGGLKDKKDSLSLASLDKKSISCRSQRQSKSMV